MLIPDVAALRRAAGEVDALARAIGARSESSARAIENMNWYGRRRDGFMLDFAATVTRPSEADVSRLHMLASDLRALAADAEERIATIRRIEVAARAEVDRLIGVARAGLRALTLEFDLAAMAATVLPGSHGIEHRIALARAALARLESARAAFPPPGDVRWLTIGNFGLLAQQ